MRIISFILLITTSFVVYAQDDQSNAINTAIPILNITTNARIGGFGEVGVVSSSFYKDAGLVQNPALLAKSGNYAGVNYSNMSWLKSEASDMKLFSINAYYSFGSKNAIGYQYKHFNIGEVGYVDSDGSLLYISHPTESFHQITYSHSPNKNLSFGFGLKYIKSDLDGYKIKPVKTIAVDVGIDYEKKYLLKENYDLNINLGCAINNFGPKVQYGDYPEFEKEFIPTTLRLGILLNPNLYLSDKLRLNIDFAYQVDKLLVPTPPFYSNYTTEEISKGKDPNISSFKALYQSFYDAPNGISEELDEIIHKIGTELRLNYTNIFYVALRYGKHIQDETKGIKYNTKGVGIGAFGFCIDYKKISSKNTLNNTKTITLCYCTNLEDLLRF